MSRPAQAEISTNQEYRLLEHIDRLSRHREGRRAVHIHISRLKSENRRDHHMRIAANTFENQVKSFDGQLFRLANQDIFFIYRDVDPGEMDEAVMRLRYLFTDDPLVQDSDEDDQFSTWYDLERQYDELHAVAQTLYDEVQKRQKRLAQIAGAGGPVGGKPPINPHRLGELIDIIAKADLSNLLRRQAVFAILSNQAPQPLFRELFISIGDLQKLVLPNYDILGESLAVPISDRDARQAHAGDADQERRSGDLEFLQPEPQRSRPSCPRNSWRSTPRSRPAPAARS